MSLHIREPRWVRAERTWRFLPKVAALVVLYVVAARIGLRFAIPPGNATAIWPASGIALAGVLLLGRRAVPGVFLGALVANLFTSVSFAEAAAIGVGNAAEALIASALLRGRARLGLPCFRGARNVFFFTAAAMLACASAATVGVLTLRVSGRLPWPLLPANWLTWWLGDIVGIVIVTPLLGALTSRVRFSGSSAVEALLAMISVGLVSQAIFGGLLDAASARNVLYVPLFLLLWLALRFEQGAVATASLVLTAAAVWGTSRGLGAYGGGTFPASLLDLQLLMLTYALTGLAVVATVSRRRRAEGALRLSRHRLALVVEQRTEELRRALSILRAETDARARREEMERLRLATALDSAGEGIIITDAAATITHVNPSFELMTGYSRSEVVGKNPRILKSGTADAGIYIRLWETISQGGVWRGSFVDRKKDASLYDADTTIAPIREADGSVDGYVAVTRDVTEQRNGERALRESETRLRTVFECASAGIVTVDENGRIESANPAAEALFGSGLVGRPAAMLVHAEGKENGFGPPYGIAREVLGRRSDGSTFPMELLVNDLLVKGRRLVAGFVRDGTERRARLEAEKALVVKHEELRLAREIQQRFYPEEAPGLPGYDVAGASHPAEEAGGDYFDYFAMEGGCLGLVIGDVSGHGLGPALLMSQTRACLRALLLVSQDVGELVTRLNDFLVEDCGGHRFVTLFLACVDPRTRRLSYAGAGHQSYLLREDGCSETLAATGIPLGIAPASLRRVAERSLRPGDVLVLLTDGIEEALSPDGRELGRAAVLEVARAHRHRSAREIVDALLCAASRFAAGAAPLDDATAVVVKVLA